MDEPRTIEHGESSSARWLRERRLRLALLIAFVPALEAAAPFAWFFAAGIAAVVYYFIADRSQRLEDVDGEAIAVASTH